MPGSSALRPSVPTVVLSLAAVLAAAAPPLAVVRAAGEGSPDHIVISEVATGGASASDELIELYNPTAASLPLEGLELVYVSATGATISRRATWEVGAPSLSPGRHLLVANEAGVYAAAADAVYASGMAAAGGSVALRTIGASSAIDAVGWGTAVSAWLEGSPAPAPAAGTSLERLPGGALGSSRDTDDNAADFVERAVPDPQNLASPPVPDPDPGPTATVGPSLTPTPIPAATVGPATPSPAASASPAPTEAPVVPIATARALPDGAAVTVEGTALTGSDFGDGGGYLADDSGGIAILLTGGSFDRGQRLRISGTLDDRFAQRTLRADGVDATVLGNGAEPPPMPVATGAVGEAVEGRLVRVAGTIVGSASVLSGGVAFDLDDGSGPTRLYVPATSGIATSAWEAGTRLELVGVVGQRDSTGTGTTGYRVQPRDPADVSDLQAPASPTAAPSSSPAPAPTEAPSPGAGVASIGEARAMPKNARVRVAGVVTLPSGLLDASTAVLQDATGAILLRLGDGAGPLALGERIEVDGVRSTKSGMESLRVTTAPRRHGSGEPPAATALTTGGAGEADEARLVVVRGEVVAAARRVSSGTISFEIDDGTGPLRVVLAASLRASRDPYVAGARIEVRGVLGQETTGAQPLRGYRVWPRSAAEVTLLGPGDAASGDLASPGADADDGGSATVSLDALEAADPGDLRIGATLVVGPWAELGIGGLLWDGGRLVALEAAQAERVAAVLAGRSTPLPLELAGLRAVGGEGPLGLPIAATGNGSDALVVGSGGPAAPSTKLPSAGERPRWVTLVGALVGSRASPDLQVGGTRIRLERRCDDEPDVRAGRVAATGIAPTGGDRIVLPCGGLRAAPHLARPAALIAAASDRPPAPLAGGLDRPRSSAPLAAAFLGTAAGLLLAVAGAVRWLRGGSPDGAPATTDGAGGAPDGEDAEVPPNAPPVLTLVSVPRERGP